MTKLFFATDIHGSDVCWKKFINAAIFYDADVSILGGDLTGKAIVPIINQGNGVYKAVLLEQNFVLDGPDQLQEMIKRIRSRGYYPYITNSDEIDELNKNPERIIDLFKNEVLRTAEQWLAYADERLEKSGIRCYVAPGNDDMFEIDNLIRSSKHVKIAEGEVIELDNNHEMISSGWSNPTPWHTFREEDEDNLLNRYQVMIPKVKNMNNCVFNIHVPPYNSSLDSAPELTKDLRPKYAGNLLIPVGSTSVRAVIEDFQPLLGLFGHIHEAKGTTRLGRTLCINPGSMYEQGSLLGALVNLNGRNLKDYILTTG